jgi:hypothetical protein
MEFGAYAQTHEEHSNDMEARTTGAICLGPSGNDQGGHYFMSLTTGRRLHRHHWTGLPLPADARDRVNQLGRQQGMPPSLTFADRFGCLIPDMLAESDDRSHSSDSDDSDYDPASTSMDSDDDDDFDPDDDNDDNADDARSTIVPTNVNDCDPS